MTRKPRIKPIPIPFGEDPLITISMQEKQIDMLLKRIETLTEAQDMYAKDCRNAESRLEATQAETRDLERTIRRMRAAYTRMTGYQDCAREFFRIMVEK